MFDILSHTNSSICVDVYVRVCVCLYACHYTQVRIQDLVKGGPQLLRPKVADIAKRS